MTTSADPAGRAWEELVTVALLGTERRPATLPRPPGPLGDLLTRLAPGPADRAGRGQGAGDAGEPAGPDEPAPPVPPAAAPAGTAEDALLGAAAAVAAYRRAGRVAPADREPAVEPCPPETRRRCSPRAAWRLRGMLERDRHPLLAEWLALAARNGRRPCEEDLPALLDRGGEQRALQGRIAEVLGARGRWLAARNPDWAWALGAGPLAPTGGGGEVWHDGVRDARLLLLARRRREDPGQGLALLASTWAREPAGDRAAFLLLLAPGLSVADEAFLEDALDDRAASVRRAAAALLTRLPGSRRAARAAARVRGLLVPAGRPAAHLAVALPERPGPDWQRDGLALDGKGGLTGRSGLLAALAAAAPLAVWEQDTGLPADQLVRLATGGGPAARLDGASWRGAAQALAAGWAEAATWQRAERWALPLVDADVTAALGALPADRAHELVRTRLTGRARRRGLGAGLLAPGAAGLLEHCPGPWPPALSGAFLHALVAALRALRRHDLAPAELVSLDGREHRPAAALELLPRLAHRLDPGLAGEARVLLEPDATGRAWWSRPVDALVTTLEHRRELHEELRS